jgi:hypothetical protein
MLTAWMFRRSRNAHCVAALWMAISFLYKKILEICNFGGLGGPGAPETLGRGRGRNPPPFGRVSGAPGAAQTPKMTGFRSIIIFF